MEAILAEIGAIFTKVMTWIPTVLTTLVEQPIILFFIAFPLVGVVIRWARRVVHL